MRIAYSSLGLLIALGVIQCTLDSSSESNSASSSESALVSSSSITQSSSAGSIGTGSSANTLSSSSNVVVSSSVVGVSSSTNGLSSSAIVVRSSSSTAVVSSSAVARSSSSIVALSSSAAVAAPFGSLTFTVTPVDNDKGYSNGSENRHIIASWVETESGQFVKTLLAYANKRKEWLDTWEKASSFNTVDAVTGATSTSWSPLTIVWNGTDVKGSTVTSGKYILKVEYTTEHLQGPLVSVPFTVGATNQTVTPADETYYKSMKLVYTVK